MRDLTGDRTLTPNPPRDAEDDRAGICHSRSHAHLTGALSPALMLVSNLTLTRDPVREFSSTGEPEIPVNYGAARCDRRSRAQDSVDRSRCVVLAPEIRGAEEPMAEKEQERDLSGHTLGDFILLERIDEGGWASVYRASQPELRREVVIKVLRRHLSTGVALERFQREAQLASRLDHPYAAHVYAYGVVEVGEDAGVAWIAMEFVHGITLSVWLAKHGPMPPALFVPFFDCIAEVVHVAHERGIIHRDLKPSNMMVIELGGRLFPKLLDFGIAKVEHEITFPEDHQRGDSVSTTRLQPRTRPGAYRTNTDPDRAGRYVLTRTGAGIGTWPYMAPEQWGAAGSVDRAADVYSLGIIIFEVLGGKRPYNAKTADEYYKLHCHAEIPALGTTPVLSGDFPRAIDERVLSFALAKKPIVGGRVKPRKTGPARSRDGDQPIRSPGARRWRQHAASPGRSTPR